LRGGAGAWDQRGAAEAQYTGRVHAVNESWWIQSLGARASRWTHRGSTGGFVRARASPAHPILGGSLPLGSASPGFGSGAKPPAEGPSVEPRRACEGAPAPCRQTPTAGSLAPRAAMSAAPDSDRAGSGGTGRSSRGPRASSRDRTRGPSETRPAPAGSRVARSTPHRSSTGRPRRAGVAGSGKGSRGDRGPPDRAHVPGRSPSPRRTPSRRLSPAPPAARAGAARPVAQAAAPRPTREAARAPAPAQGSAAALAAERVAMRAMVSTMAAAASAPAGGPGPAAARVVASRAWPPAP